MKPLLPPMSPETFRTLVSVDIVTGNLTWIAGEKSGQPAFLRVDSCGYLFERINGRTYQAHRVIWAMVNGEWPSEIDHIDGNPKNNILANLREVSHFENLLNQRMHSNNTSGTCGVSLDKTRNKWKSYISVRGTQKYLGTFDHKEDAISARKTAEAALGFHPNHGRAA